jgi:hypothetical protein
MTVVLAMFTVGQYLQEVVVLRLWNLYRLGFHALIPPGVEVVVVCV